MSARAHWRFHRQAMGNPQATLFCSMDKPRCSQMDRCSTRRGGLLCGLSSTSPALFPNGPESFPVDWLLEACAQGVKARKLPMTHIILASVSYGIGLYWHVHDVIAQAHVLRWIMFLFLQRQSLLWMWRRNGDIYAPDSNCGTPRRNTMRHYDAERICALFQVTSISWTEHYDAQKYVDDVQQPVLFI